MISVIKRDGSTEGFERLKVRSCLMRALAGEIDGLYQADVLSSALEFYLHRRKLRCISSPALMEMVLTALKAAGQKRAARRMERFHARRMGLRGRLVLHHGFGPPTAWSKEWLAHHARSLYDLGATAARILAGDVELQLLRRRRREIGRGEVMRMLHREAQAFGLTALSPATEKPLTA